MADLKISQLGAISILTPATDVLPVVDSGGVTKKITTNQILGSGGTATLASATITGDLTVDTSTLKVDSANNRVGIGTASPAYNLDVIGSASIGGTGSSFTRFTSNGGITTLGVGAYLSVQGSGNPSSGSGIELNGGANPFVLAYNRDGSAYLPLTLDGSSVLFKTSGSEKVRIDAAGNCGIGVTPSAWGGFGNLQLVNGSVSVSGYDQSLGVNYFSHSSGAYKYTVNGNAVKQGMFNGQFTWSVAPSGTAGNAITFTQAMTLDASGRLLVGSVTPFTDLTGSKEVKIGDGGIQTFSSAIAAATPTNIARGGVGGLVYVGGFNGTGQYGAVVLWTSASATVVSVINNTGSTITFGVSAGFLQITSSLALTTIGANCIRL